MAASQRGAPPGIRPRPPHRHDLRAPGPAHERMTTMTTFPVALPGAQASTLMWADPAEVEPAALDQLRNISALPWVHGVACHARRPLRQGRDGRLGHRHAATPSSPAAVGVDIGCGMSAVRTNLTAADLPDDLGAAARGDRGGDAGRLRRARRPVDRARRDTGCAAGWDAFWAGSATCGPKVARRWRAGRRSSWARSAAATTSSRLLRLRRRRPRVADAALRVAQHRQGAGRAAHRRARRRSPHNPTCPTATWPCSSPARRRWTPTAVTCSGRRSTRGATGRS